MPAAAVIPAPIAYIKVVAVKKLVVGFRGSYVIVMRWTLACCFRGGFFWGNPRTPPGGRGKATAGGAHLYFSKTSRALNWCTVVADSRRLL